MDNYLLPAFGSFLRDMTTLNIQRYFSQMSNSELSRESRLSRRFGIAHR